MVYRINNYRDTEHLIMILPWCVSACNDAVAQILAARNETRAAKLCRNDWYRLGRSLEVRNAAIAAAEHRAPV